jgi:hypothetical protein
MVAHMRILEFPSRNLVEFHLDGTGKNLSVLFSYVSKVFNNFR